MPGTHKLDSTFNTQQNVRTIGTASKDYDARAVMQDEQGNLWLAGRYTYVPDDAYDRAWIALLDAGNGNFQTTYNSGGSTPGLFERNEYSYEYPYSLHQMKNNKVYAGFTQWGGALLDANSTGLGVNKTSYSGNARSYTTVNDSTVIAASYPNSANKFRAFKPLVGTNYAGHTYTNYFNGNSFEAAAFPSAPTVPSVIQVVKADAAGKLIMGVGGTELYRFKPNSNERDSTFGTAGSIYLPGFGTNLNPVFTSIVIQPDGKILVLQTGNERPTLYRLNNDGTADNTFGNNGNIQWPVTYPLDEISTGTMPWDIALLSNGKIAVAGMDLYKAHINNGSTTGNLPSDYTVTEPDGYMAAFVLLLTTSGQYDNSFADGQYNHYSINMQGIYLQVNDVYVNENDDIFIAGRKAGGNQSYTSAFVAKISNRANTVNCSSFVLDNIGTTNATTQQGLDGAINVTLVGGQAPYTYQVLLNGNMEYMGNFSSTTYSIPAAASNTGYTVLINDANGCQVSGNAIVINCYPVSVATSVTANASAEGLCDGTAEVTISNGAAPYTFTNWLNNGNPYQTANTTAMLSNLCDSTYTLHITDGYGCVLNTTFTVATETAPSCSVNFTYMVQPDASCPEVTFSSTDAFTPITVEISYNGGSSNTVVQQNLPFIMEQFCPADYLMYLTDANGCKDTLEFTIEQGVGINNIAASSIALNLYPNPAQHTLHLSSSQAVQYIEVINAIGQTQYSAANTSNTIPVAQLAKGVYILKATTAKGTAYTRFIKE